MDLNRLRKALQDSKRLQQRYNQTFAHNEATVRAQPKDQGGPFRSSALGSPCHNPGNAKTLTNVPGGNESASKPPVSVMHKTTTPFKDRLKQALRSTWTPAQHSMAAAAIATQQKDWSNLPTPSAATALVKAPTGQAKLSKTVAGRVTKRARIKSKELQDIEEATKHILKTPDMRANVRDMEGWERKNEIRDLVIRGTTQTVTVHRSQRAVKH